MAADHPKEESHGARWLVLALLSAAMAVSFIDRYALTMMITPIKAELGLSDTAIGLLTGFAFSAFYSTFGLVMARISDRGAHRTIIIVSLLFWSAMTALSGAVQNFWQITLTRFGVGAGEAGVAPTSHALIASLFPVSLRSAALAIFSAAGPLGILLAFAISAPFESHFGWRWTFAILGVPGVLLAFLFMAFGRHVRVPPVVTASGAVPAAPWIGSTLALLAIPRFRSITLTIAMLAMLTFGQTQWLPTFMERSFGLSRAEIGPLLAMTQGVGMLLGMVIGGALFDAMARRDERWRTRLLALCLIGGFPIVLAVYSVGSPMLGASLAGLSAFVLALPTGQLWAIVQGVVPPAQRATGAATCLMFTSIVGLGLGPMVIGSLSDVFEPRLASESLRFALLCTIAGGGVVMTIQTLLLSRDIATRGGVQIAAQTA